METIVANSLFRMHGSLFAFFVMLTFTVQTKAQEASGKEIRGLILHAETEEPVPFANIFNRTLGQGVISASDGSFRIAIADASDHIQITFIGFQLYSIPLKSNVFEYTIYLEENVQLLQEVVISPKLNAYLYTLIQQVRKRPTETLTSKSYYQLRTYKDGEQVELVESFFNAGLNGYDIAELRFKTGRIALRSFNGTYFTSQAGSQAVSAMHVMHKNPFWPLSPLETGRNKCIKTFDLQLDMKFIDEQGDSVYVISYRPHKPGNDLFSGEVWINASNQTLIQAQYKAARTKVHPFLPLFPTDKILRVDIDITKTFESVDGVVVPNRVNFVYHIHYQSRIGKPDAFTYELESNALIFNYDYRAPFFQPLFDLSSGSNFDYRLINAFPHNDFFWKFHNEYIVADVNGANEVFYSDPESYKNTDFSSYHKNLRGRFFEHPYIHWNGNRVRLYDMVDTTKSPSGTSGAIKALQYHLEVKLFLDVNTYSDSTGILTATIFDPYETFYNLPIDQHTTCFINMYFDFCEIYRRKLALGLDTLQEPAQESAAYYNHVMKDMRIEGDRFLSEVERGTNRDAMVKWNAYILDELNIDNLRYFGLE